MTKSQEQNAAAVITLVLMLPLSAFRGWVLSVIWGWFVVPLGVVDIGVWHAAGLGLIVTFFHAFKTKDDPEPLKTAVSTVFMTLFGGLIVLIVGALYSAFMG